MAQSDPPVERPVFRLEILFAKGEFIGGNHTHAPRRDGRGRVLTKGAKDQRARLGELAQRAVKRQEWVVPKYCRMDAIAFNLNHDGDNILKPVCDAFEGILYPNDRRILDRNIAIMWAEGPPRLIVAVQEVDRKDYDLRVRPGRSKKGQ